MRDREELNMVTDKYEDYEKMIAFIKESNFIEDIHREPTPEEVKEYQRFINLNQITIDDLNQFVRVYQPGAVLRDRPGLNVRIGKHHPARGGPEVKEKLEILLDSQYCPFERHRRYEVLHPYTDGNGRSGRMLWQWQMIKIYKDNHRLGFLHSWYYQSLDNQRVNQRL